MVGLRLAVEKIYSWDELAEAHRRVETGRVVGKIAVVALHAWHSGS
jgi:hypothetical protein